LQKDDTVMADDPEVTLQSLYGRPFEKMVIWLLLFDLEFAAKAFAVLDGDVFEDEVNAVIADTGAALYKAGGGKVVSFTAISSELTSQARAGKKGTAAHETLTKAHKRCAALRKKKTPDAGTLEYVKKNVSIFLVKSKVKDALLRSTDYWKDNRFDDILKTVEDAVRTTERSFDQSVGIDFNVLPDRIKRYKEMYGSGGVKLGSPIGIPLMDKQMRGGLEIGTLGVVMGPAKCGKSMALVNIIRSSLSVGLDVVLFTLELREAAYALRMDATLTGIPINEIAAHTKKHLRALQVATNKMKGRLYIKQYGSDQASVQDLYVYLKMLQSEKGFSPNVVVVDYLGWLIT